MMTQIDCSLRSSYCTKTDASMHTELLELKEMISSIIDLLKNKNYFSALESIQKIDSSFELKKCSVLKTDLLQEHITSINRDIIHVLKHVKNGDLSLIQKPSYSLLKVMYVSKLLQNNHSQNHDSIIKKCYDEDLDHIFHSQVIKDRALYLVGKKQSEEAMRLINTFEYPLDFEMTFLGIVQYLITENDLENAIFLISQLRDQEMLLKILSHRLLPQLVKNGEIHQALGNFLTAVHGLASIDGRIQLYRQLSAHLLSNNKFEEALEIDQLSFLGSERKCMPGRWLIKNNPIQNDVDFEKLGDLSVFNLDIFSEIFTSFSLQGVRNCLTLNKDWYKLSLHVIKDKEFKNILNIKKLIFNSLNAFSLKNINSEGIQNILSETHPSTSPIYPIELKTLSEIQKFSDKEMEQLLRKLEHTKSTIIEKLCLDLSGHTFSYFLENFTDVLKIYFKTKVKRYSPTEFTQESLEILFKNNRFYRIEMTLSLLEVCEETNQLYKFYVLKLFENGLTKTASNFLLKQRNVEACKLVIEELIEKKMLKEAFQAAKHIHPAAPYHLKIFQILIDDKKADDIFLLNDAIFFEPQPFLTAVIQIFIKGGYTDLIIKKILEISDASYRDQIKQVFLKKFEVSQDFKNLLTKTDQKDT